MKKNNKSRISFTVVAACMLTILITLVHNNPPHTKADEYGRSVDGKD